MIRRYVYDAIMFPGIIIHQLTRLLICRLLHIAVFDACLYRFAIPAGYVLHEEPREAWRKVLLIAGPLMGNSLLGALIAFPAAVPIDILGAGSPLDFFLMWFGVSIAAQAFPVKEDALWLASSLKSPDLSGGWKAIVAPLVAVTYVGVFGRFMSLDVVYGACVTLIMPYFFMWWGGR